MRVAILSDSLSAAARIYDGIRHVSGCEIFLVVRVQGNSWLLWQAARWLKYKHRRRSVQLLLRGQVKFLHHPFDHPASLRILQQGSFDIGLHNAGVIYRESTIHCFRLGILNAHIGILPEYRGRSVMEWSLIQGDRTGITVFFIDGGIDTGEKIVLWEQVDVWHTRSTAQAKQFLFAQDVLLFRKALERLQSPAFQFETNNIGSGRRYYVMSNLFSEVIDNLLAERKEPLR